MNSTMLTWCEECGIDMHVHGGKTCPKCGIELCYDCMKQHICDEEDEEDSRTV